jgi:hypothetical protein
MQRNTLYRWLIVLVPLAVFLSQPIGVGDLAVWIAHGLAILKAHAILRHDVFSVLATRPLVYPSWGISVVYALFYKLGGLNAAALLHPGVMILLLFLIYSKSVFRLERPWSARNLAFLVFSLVGSVILWTDRPNFIALVPLVCTFSLLNSTERLGKNKILELALWQVLWVNLHGSFILLPAMTAWRLAFSSRENRESDLTALLATLAACLINPFGAQVFPYVLETFTISRSRIEEWQNTSVFSYFPSGFCFFVLVLGLVPWIRKNPRGLRSPYFLLVGLGFLSIRFAAVPALLLLPFAHSAGLLKEEEGPPRKTSRPQSIANAGIACAWAILPILFNPYLKSRFAFLLPPSKREVYDFSAPIGITRKIRESKLRGPVLADWIYGSFLMLDQPNPIFLDTRNIIYTDEQFQTLTRVLNAEPGWREFLARYGVAFVVLQKPSAALAQALRQDPAWELLAEDRHTLLFARQH